MWARATAIARNISSCATSPLSAIRVSRRRTPRLELDGLDQRARDMIAAADTFFVASYVDRDNGERQVDVSHRGGKAGFVRIGEDGVLTVPDFAGNLFFNTLGNFLLNPKAGLLFVDFATGDMLQMTGRCRSHPRIRRRSPLSRVPNGCGASRRDA